MNTETDKIKKITKRNLPSEVKAAVKAGQAKKAEELCVLDLREAASFTDFFIIMHGNSSRQNVAIYDYIGHELKKVAAGPSASRARPTANGF